ncbi:MAG: hypothetical protein ACRC8S_09860 [Fimbriiglobus sp.]
MSEPRKVAFKPRWPVTLSPEEEALVDNFTVSGSVPPEAPRIDTRILPRDRSCSLSLRSLGEVAELTQKLADFAGYDVIHGPNPDFADLRSLKSDLTNFTRLTSEPFEVGSFVIPASLQANPYILDHRTIETDKIAERFGDILSLLDREAAPTEVSVGSLQTLEALARVLKREATAIEFSTRNSDRKQLVNFEVSERFIGRVREVLVRRRPTQAQLETLVGRVTELDIVEGKLLLSVPDLSQRVKGSFSHMFTPTLLESLNQVVKLEGQVERNSKRPVMIHIHSVELIGTEG